MDEKRILMERAYEKLEVAKSLFENEFYPDAVSRAYYAMFYAARALLSKKNIYPKTHRGVISQFGLLFVKAGKFKIEMWKCYELTDLHVQNERAGEGQDDGRSEGGYGVYKVSV